MTFTYSTDDAWSIGGDDLSQADGNGFSLARSGTSVVTAPLLTVRLAPRESFYVMNRYATAEVPQTILVLVTDGTVDL